MKDTNKKREESESESKHIIQLFESDKRCSHLPW